MLGWLLLQANSETTVFTTAPRFATSKRSAGDMPGPGQYNAMNSVGPQHLSKNKNIPHVAFSQSKRENREKVYISHDHEKSRFGANSPGPALVGGRSSIGKQVRVCVNHAYALPVQSGPLEPLPRHLRLACETGVQFFQFTEGLLAVR